MDFTQGKFNVFSLPGKRAFGTIDATGFLLDEGGIPRYQIKGSLVYSMNSSVLGPIFPFGDGWVIAREGDDDIQLFFVESDPQSKV